MLVASGEKRAATTVLLFSVTVHVPVPEHPLPNQPVKMEPASGVAVKVTTVPALKEALQVAPQSMPAGEEATAPAPVPVLVTARA